MQSNLFIIRRYANRNEWEEKLKDAYGVIYLWTNLVNGKEYVGQVVTYRLDAREKEHEKVVSINSSYLERAIQKYGEQSFVRTILDVAYSKEELDELEDKYIQEYNTLSPNGYNLKTGGSCGKHCEETKRKMSESKKGKTGDKNNHFKGYIQVTTVETNKVIFIGQSLLEIEEKVPSVKGEKLYFENISSVLRGCYKSTGGYIYEYVNKETYEQWLKNTGGQVDVDAIANCKPFIKVINKDTKELVYIGEGTREIERNVKSVTGGKLNHCNISGVLTSRQKIHGGYTFEYCTKSEYDNFWNN